MAFSKREEAYSDWLGWILEQIKDAGRYEAARSAGRRAPFEVCFRRSLVKREFAIPDGRLDLSIDFGKHLFVIVEIKTKSFDEDAVQDQLKKYARWAQEQPRPTLCYLPQ